jgi:hypothetical protein
LYSTFSCFHVVVIFLRDKSIPVSLLHNSISLLSWTFLHIITSYPQPIILVFVQNAFLCLSFCSSDFHMCCAYVCIPPKFSKWLDLIHNSILVLPLDARHPTVAVTVTARGALPLPTSSKRSDPGLWRNGRRGLDDSPAAPTVFNRPPISLTQTPGWHSLGCYKDSSMARVLRTRKSAKTIGGVTIEHCQAGCLSASFKYAGVEYGEECCKFTLLTNLCIKLTFRA